MFAVVSRELRNQGGQHTREQLETRAFIMQHPHQLLQTCVHPRQQKDLRMNILLGQRNRKRTRPNNIGARQFLHVALINYYTTEVELLKPARQHFFHPDLPPRSKQKTRQAVEGVEKSRDCSSLRKSRSKRVISLKSMQLLLLHMSTLLICYSQHLEMQ